MEAAFKVKNYPMIAGYIFGNLWLIYLMFSGHVPDFAWAKDLSKIVPGGVAATIFAVAINELFNGQAKARLVFRRWTNPLPGSRAFSHFGPKDPRVNMEVITQRFGNPGLPDTPEAQNKLWYKILKLNESRPSVAYAHQYYLLMRDLSFSTVVLFLATGVAALLLKPSSELILIAALMLGAEFLVAMRAAESLGCDLVRNALAEESAKVS